MSLPPYPPSLPPFLSLARSLPLPCYELLSKCLCMTVDAPNHPTDISDVHKTIGVITSVGSDLGEHSNMDCFLHLVYQAYVYLTYYNQVKYDVRETVSL